jgi:CubicO group peptidase (beta-lactamase class C family)
VQFAAFGQNIDYAKVDASISSLVAKNKFSGVVLIAQKGKIKYEKANGFIEYVNQTPLQSSTIFELASVSKQFTAMTIMMLHEKGLLQYDELVEKYIDIPYKNITIRQLLTHTSGLPDYQAIMDEHWDKSKVANNNDIITYLKDEIRKSDEKWKQWELENEGKVWWHNSKINKFSIECPGEGWVLGMIFKAQND